MPRLLDPGLETLAQMLAKMGKLAKTTVSEAIDSFIHNKHLYEKTKSDSDVLLELGVEIEGKAVELLARYQPLAKDLRLIKSYIKISYDYARLGRYAYDITDTEKVFEAEEGCDRDFIEKMGSKVLELIDRSLESVDEMDEKLARSLREMDDEVDDMYDDYLEGALSDREHSVTCLVGNLFVARHLERIADHCVYMGESIVYAVTAERVVLE
jgi:phosphate transport system protein